MVRSSGSVATTELDKTPDIGVCLALELVTRRAERVRFATCWLAALASLDRSTGC